MTNKTVSIVMCTYNGERYLKEQLMSLLNQTYSPIEIIIQDDLSTDNTLEIIHDYQERYPGIIHLFQNSRRLGYNQNFLSAYQKANGYYIASADQDDIWETNKIEILIREIGDSTLIFHNSVLFNQKNPNMGLLHKKDWGEHPHPLSVLVNPKAYGHQILFRREVLPLIHQFETYNVSYDSLVYTLCSSMGDVKYINQVLVHWRRHENASTFTSRQANKNKLYGYYTALCALHDHTKRQISREYFRLYQRIQFKFEPDRQVIACMKAGTLYLCPLQKRTVPAEKQRSSLYLKKFLLALILYSRLRIRNYSSFQSTTQRSRQDAITDCSTPLSCNIFSTNSRKAPCPPWATVTYFTSCFT